jgi:hypothetical protein
VYEAVKKTGIRGLAVAGAAASVTVNGLWRFLVSMAAGVALTVVIGFGY